MQPIEHVLKEVNQSEGKDGSILKTIKSMATRESGVLTAMVLPNAEAHSPFEMPRGIAFEVSATSPLRADWLRRKPTTAIAVARLTGKQSSMASAAVAATSSSTMKGINNAAIASAYEKLFRTREEEVRQVLQTVGAQFENDAPTSLEARSGGRDTEHWEAELGPRGILGFYKQPRRSARDQDHYYLVAKCGAGAAADEFYEKWMARAQSSTPPRLDDSELKRDQDTLVSYAQRSACRLLYKVASALGLEDHDQEDQLKVAADVESIYMDSSDHSPPRLIQPDFLQVNNTMASMMSSGPKRNPSSGAAAITTAVHIDNASARLGPGHPYNGKVKTAVLMLGPSDGLALVPLAQKISTAIIPAGTRKCLSDEDAIDHAQAFPDSVDLRNYLYEGDALSLGAFMTMNRYEEPNDQLFNFLKQASGSDEETIIMLEPICVKVGNPVQLRSACELEDQK